MHNEIAQISLSSASSGLQATSQDKKNISPDVRACSVLHAEFWETKERTGKSMGHPGLLNAPLSRKACAWHATAEEWALHHSLS